MKTETRIATVRYRWDDPCGVEPGWYAEARDADGNYVDDSEKVCFRVDVDAYGSGERRELHAALRAAYPGADVVHTG